MEAVCQWHRQRSGLCSWSHVCQSHLFWGQQGYCKFFKVLSHTDAAPPAVSDDDASYLTLLYLRLKIWLHKLNGHLRMAWRTWDGWTQKQKKQQKKRWGVSLGRHECLIWEDRLICLSAEEMLDCHLVGKCVVYTFFLMLTFIGRCNIQHGWISRVHHECHKAGQSLQWCRWMWNCAIYAQNHTVVFLYDKVSHFAFLKHWIIFLSFSLRSCQSSTSKMSCSTTTFQPEWLQTSWEKLPTETSELLP